MSRFKRIFLNLRVMLVIFSLLIAVIALAPNPFREGAAIRSIDRDSAASLAGMVSPSATDSPSGKERVVFVNNVPVKKAEDYYKAISGLPPNRTIQVKTTRGIYRITTRPIVNFSVLPELEDKNITFVESFNTTVNGSARQVNQTVTRKVKVNKTVSFVNGTEDIGLAVYDAPKTNLRMGLDLQGGTRVLLMPETRVSDIDMETIVENMKQRLNVFGLGDVVVRPASDLSGNQYILVEIAGVNEQEVKELLAKQGKFEAKIANNTVFRGGNDITYVCRSADCSGIDPSRGCGESNGEWVCGFRFSITLSQEAAQRQSDATKDLDVIVEGNGRFLDESLELYLDDQLVDKLLIGAELKGKPATDVSISGSGSGGTQQEAIENSLSSMKRLQTILITGSLPVKLDVIKTDAVSPVVGSRFSSNALLLAALAALAVGIILMIAYRRIAVAVPILFTSLIEILMMLGVAAIIGWNIDLAAIAGIIAAVGTGVNDQIIITDEALKKTGSYERRFIGWKDKIKSAFFIIFGAYVTLVLAMIPLLFAGAGLLRGFALTTIIGISIGVFITRPAYSNVLEILSEKE
ncbi:hypothetical protein HYU11_00095 [Candidatus Woesearchaeota archaeon]|nr:hypothetical protein [Candidatus Woesearchaeota archaeon]